MSDDFPTPDGFEVVDEDDNTRPGEPLHPGENTIVDGDNNALKEGDAVQVWFESWADGYGTETLTGELFVIGGDDDGDVFGIPRDQDADDVSRVYRISGSMESIGAGVVIDRPQYDPEKGILTTTRHVEQRGFGQKPLVEVRDLGLDRYMKVGKGGGL